MLLWQLFNFFCFKPENNFELPNNRNRVGLDRSQFFESVIKIWLPWQRFLLRRNSVGSNCVIIYFGIFRRSHDMSQALHMLRSLNALLSQSSIILNAFKAMVCFSFILTLKGETQSLIYLSFLAACCQDE